jgi:hypothetical protein
MGSNPQQAISLFADGFAIQYRQSIIDLGLRYGVPMVSGWPAFARSGALFTYGPHLDSSNGDLPVMPIAFFKARDRLTCRSSNRPSSSLWSISKLPKRSA